MEEGKGRGAAGGKGELRQVPLRSAEGECDREMLGCTGSG